MGLDFSHGDAHWSYGGFNCFRGRIAAAVGIDWEKLFETRDFAPLIALKDPIKPLLNHSDCDGYISPSVCAKVAPRLKEIVKGWPHGDYDRKMAMELAKGMADAAKRKQRLEFC